jgi:hypothetical protein
VAFIAAILLALPFLNAPLLQDDVVHRVMLLDRTPGVHWGPLELYDFIGAPARPAALLRDRGFLPWFTADGLKLRFFRPLSSALLAADARMFGEHVWAARLHSLFWFLGLVAMCGRLHRRFLSPPSAALGTVIYALAVGHALPVSWIAARHALISSTFALVSFWFHVRARQDGKAAGRWLSAVMFAAGLLAGEMALGALALISAWELLGRKDTIAARCRALLPVFAITVLYLAGYVVMDYGVRGSGGYVSIGDGIGSAPIVVRHFLILIAELIAATPSDAFGTASASVQLAGAIWGTVVAGVAVAVFWLTRSDRSPDDVSAMRWLPAAAAAAALPGAPRLDRGPRPDRRARSSERRCRRPSYLWPCGAASRTARPDEPHLREGRHRVPCHRPSDRSAGAAIRDRRSADPLRGATGADCGADAGVHGSDNPRGRCGSDHHDLCSRNDGSPEPWS